MLLRFCTENPDGQSWPEIWEWAETTGWQNLFVRHLVAFLEEKGQLVWWYDAQGVGRWRGT
jgi:hypothetical protein